MLEFGEKQIKKIQATSQKAKSALLLFKNRFVKATKSVAYWSSVVTVGFFLAAVIADVGFGVEIFSVANASVAEGIAIVMGNILYYLVFGVVLLAAFSVAYILEIVLLYPYGSPELFAAWSGNGFVNVDQVVVGWKLVRDICNIFFSLILVIIALASVLKIEAYSWKQLLPKFFIAAILINFSKSIAGIFTDFATVAMATFGSSFSGSFARGLLGGFGLPVLGDLTPISTGVNPNREGSGFASVLFAYVAAAAMAAIFFILMSVFAATLVFRIIMLWFLIVLSPLAYITRILPLTQRYSSQWWEMFGRYVVVGPLVTFFLWLSLTMAFGGQSTGTTVGQGFNNNNPITAAVATGTTAQATSAGITAPPKVGNFQSTNPNVLANFMVSALLLMASLKLISQMAQEFGKFTGIIESQSGAAISRMAEKMGQYGIQTFSSIGRKPEYDKAMNITDRGSPGFYLGQGLAALSATIGQPLSFAKSIVENIANSSESKQDAARVKATRLVSNLRNEQVLGREDAGGAIIGTLANVAGTLAGAGMKDGKVVFDNYLSGAGLIRGMRKVSRSGSQLDKINESREAAEKAREEIKQQKGRLLDGEGGEALEHLADATSRAGKLNNDVSNLKGADLHNADGELNTSALEDTMLDTNDGAVRAFLEGHMSSLQADQERLRKLGKTGEANALGTQMQMIQHQLDTKGTFNVGALLSQANGLSSVAGGIRDPQERKRAEANTYNQLKEVLTGSRDQAVNERDSIKKLLENTGYVFTKTPDGQETYEVQRDANGKIIHGTNFQDKKEVKKLEEAEYTAEKFADRLAMELAALSGDDGYETRLAEQEAMGKALKTLDGVYQSSQLLERMLTAESSGDIYGQRAAAMRLQENGDLNELTQRFMSVGTDGQFDPKAGTGAESLWHTVQTVFSSADERTKREIFDNMTNKAAVRGDFDRAYGASWMGGGIKIMDEEKRRQFAIFQASKMGVTQFAGLSRFSMFSEDGMGRAKVYDKGQTHIGPSMLKRYGTELADRLVFNRMNAATLNGLADPEVVAKLVRDGVDAQFIARLRQFSRDSGFNGKPYVPGQSKFVGR